MTFEDRLLEALQAEAAGPPAAPRLRGVGLPSLALVALLAVAATLLSGGSTPAVAVEREGDWITLRLLEVAASPRQVERELRAAGIDATVVVEPAPADLVGRWTRVTFPQSGSVGAVTAHEVRIPADVERVEIGLGRRVRPGETVIAPGPGCGDEPPPPPPDDNAPDEPTTEQTQVQDSVDCARPGT